MAALTLFVILLSLSAISSNAHNITDMLSGFPEYSLYNSYLSQTKLADEINSRQTLTCLVLNNAAMSALANKHPISVIKSILSLLTVLDYYDPQKLHDISDGTTLSTTLYQTTGKAEGKLGFINITDLQGGKVGFGSAAPGSKLDSTYTKSVKQIPYNISVLEISAPIIAPGMLTASAPSATDVNITAWLEKAGCKEFASLILSSGVLKIYESDVKKGLTLFAPNDEAFKAAGVPDLSKLTNAEVVTLLQYHAISQYTPIGTLKTTKGPLNTLATNGVGKYQLKATTAGDAVTLVTGVDSSRVSGTVIDDMPLCIFTVDNILLPSELFGSPPAPAPAPVPVSSPTPTPTPVTSPSPSPDTEKAPSPSELLSPPAPPTSSPDGSPAESPDSSQNSSADTSSAVEVRAAPTLFKTLATVAAFVCSWVMA